MDSPDSHQVEEQLDSEISSIRRELRNLQRRRRLLTSSLLSSENLHKRLKAHQAASTPTPLSSLTEDVSPLVQAATKHTQSNHHRVAFSTTTFPFKDPSPHADQPNLLGVRIDICRRDGRFAKPYYILLRRLPGAEKRLRVHRHTIPAFIALEKLERVYLPVPSSDVDEVGGGGDAEAEAETALKPWKRRAGKQDLRGLVREVRRQLVAWHLRLDAVEMLKEDLGGVDGLDGGGGGGDRLEPNDLGIVSMAPTAREATYVRLEWDDGRVGRFKLSSSGIVERAVVIGDGGRDRKLEGVFTGGNGRVETLLERLRGHVLSEP
ncbi:uncharacterized protein ACLA_035210 [Aspergillus clavatus NRRL 1]|uniref:Cenp-O kinetochore centromere component n=1 Tax=Aspergillus clavatus (strain ATCC 1007 / CBS 513.65 / DSM 816 / NCTC 3887 / NRRL 1 / QM 1276 / 107) TaxID=344612 RepID=A1CJJ4_ASPCL|nr:uncharacterized protein ACLA_035210 [Aspergillus clavatus NRRL 1]EAW09318.1 conserved hypothetical protein [Aspergillus clavatus NRRL 1]